jgi:hypothetical protein|tara:strand:+ start:2721 stop:2894 length:174 start_codon:yes stop_codon:yes gene_type:complete
MNKLIQRRITKGANADQSIALFNELVAAHDGDNLVFALCYNGFATEKMAYNFIGKGI